MTMSRRKRLTLFLTIAGLVILVYRGTTRRPWPYASSKQIDSNDAGGTIKYPGVEVYPPSLPDTVALKDQSWKQAGLGHVKVNKTVMITSFNKIDLVSRSKQRVSRCERIVAHPPRVAPCNQCPLPSISVHPLLPEEAIKSLKTFILFIGFARTGSSILGALLDAHPHVVLSHEYMLIGRVAGGNPKNPIFNDRRTLFSALHNRQNSLLDHSLINTSRGLITTSKGYSLFVENSYMGTYKDRIEVVGDKAAHNTNSVHLGNKKYFFEVIQHLRDVVKAPIKFINPVRNPFDIIATLMIYDLGDKELRFKANTHKIILDQDYINCSVRQFEKEIWSVVEFCESQQYEVLHVHLEDLVESPRVEVLKICNFLGISCPEDYISACTEKMFKETSKTRDSIEWPNEAIDKVHSIIQSIPHLQRYSFFN